MQRDMYGQGPVLLKKSHILQLIKNLERMRAAGLDNTDPKYQALVRLLKSQNLDQWRSNGIGSPGSPNSPAPPKNQVDGIHALNHNSMIDSNGPVSSPLPSMFPQPQLPPQQQQFQNPAQLQVPSVQFHQPPPQRSPQINHIQPFSPQLSPQNNEQMYTDLSRNSNSSVASVNTPKLAPPSSMENGVPHVAVAPSLPSEQIENKCIPPVIFNVFSSDSTGASMPLSQKAEGDSTRTNEMSSDKKVRQTNPFSPAQLYQLKAQILAYKYLSRNMPLPTHLLEAIRGVRPRIQQPVIKQQPDPIVCTPPTPSSTLPPPSSMSGAVSMNSVSSPQATMSNQVFSITPTIPSTPSFLSTSSVPPIPPIPSTPSIPSTSSIPSTTSIPSTPPPTTPATPPPFPSTFVPSSTLPVTASTVLQSFSSPSTQPNMIKPKFLASSYNTPQNTQIINPSSIPPSQSMPSLPQNAISQGEWLKFTQSSPAKVDPNFLLSEREKRISAKINRRMQELQALPISSPELKIKASIEMKALSLLELQKKVRREIAEEIRKVATMISSTDRGFYKRNRKHSAREAKMSDRLEIQLKPDQEQHQQTKHREFLSAILNHHKEFKDFHSAFASKTKKLNRAIINYHANKERKEQQKRDREAKERLRLLKANNEAAYLDLLEKTKNERLKLLLKQTDEYLQKLGAKIEEEREKILEEEEREKENENGGSEKQNEKKNQEKKNEDSTQPATKKTYYTIAHSIVEEIKEQPELLTGGTLKQYQLNGLQWLVSLFNNNLNGVLADEMGLGKTIQTIAMVAYLMEKKGLKGPYLIVVPLSTLANWQMEFEKWAPQIVKVVYKGQPNVRKQTYHDQIAPGKFNVVLTTYEYVMKDKGMLSKVKWNYLIVDEGHRMKNRHCKLATVLGQYYYSRHRLLLTGTPLQNSLPELWSLLNFLLPNIFNSVENFEQWFNAPFSAAGETVEMNEEETLLIIARLHKVLRPLLLRRLKQEVEDQLPEKVEKVLKAELSAWQKKLYKNMKRRNLLLVDPASSGNKGTNTRGLMNTLMQLRKICNHPYLFHNGEDLYPLDENIIRCSGKFVLIDRLLPKLKVAGHRVLIFSQMTSLMTIMEDYFNYRGYQFLRLDGNTKAEDRGLLLEKFNAPKSPYFIFMLSTRAGGLGLNLQTADTVILFDSDWNPQIDLQAQDRAHRIGQTQEVRVFRLVTVNSIEEKILKRANFKLNIDAKIIQAGMFNNQSNEKERKEYLESLLHDDCKEDQLKEDIPNDKQMNRMIARSEEEFDLFQQLDKEREERELIEWKQKGNTGTPPYRIMQHEELPEWLLKDPEDTPKEEITQIYGRGRRGRPEVTYDDGLSDHQWTKIIEGENPEDELSQIRTRRSSVSEKKDKKRQRVEECEINKRTKKGKEWLSPDTPGTPGTPGTPSTPGTPGTPSTPTGLPLQQRKLIKQFETLWHAVKNKTDDQGRQMSKLFLRLPSKKEYPDYYQVITTPIDMRKIYTKLERGCYQNKTEYYSDFKLLFDNAQKYNRPDSLIYTDAVCLQQLFQREFEKTFSDNGTTNSGSSSNSEDEQQVKTRKNKPGRKVKKRKRNSSDEEPPVVQETTKKLGRKKKNS